MSDKVRPGGLMRCCLLTLDTLYASAPAHQAAEGDVLPCAYCSSSMIFRKGYWEWNRE